MKEIAPVILAAGRGSRLGLNDMPKPMVEIGGRPLMQSSVESLFRMAYEPLGIKTVVGYRGDVVKKHFGGDLEYCEQRRLNGNAGALEVVTHRMESMRRRHVLVIQGDDADQATLENLQGFAHFHLRREADVSVLTVSQPSTGSHTTEFVRDREGRVCGRIPLASVDSEGRYEAGIYMFSGLFLEEFLPRLRSVTPHGQELGISKLVDLAVNADRIVYQMSSNKDYISVNTPTGLHSLRQKGMNR